MSESWWFQTCHESFTSYKRLVLLWSLEDPLPIFFPYSFYTSRRRPTNNIRFSRLWYLIYKTSEQNFYNTWSLNTESFNCVFLTPYGKKDGNCLGKWGVGCSPTDLIIERDTMEDIFYSSSRSREVALFKEAFFVLEWQEDVASPWWRGKSFANLDTQKLPIGRVLWWKGLCERDLENRVFRSSEGWEEGEAEWISHFSLGSFWCRLIGAGGWNGCRGWLAYKSYLSLKNFVCSYPFACKNTEGKLSSLSYLPYVYNDSLMSLV